MQCLFHLLVTPVLTEHSYTKHSAKDQWKKCKLLGSFIDTETDIKYRRTLVNTNMKNNQHVYESKHLSIDLKVCHFNCFETSIFLYNCALWTLTPTVAKSIDSFQHHQYNMYPSNTSNKNIRFD